jgi:hypothetical protein
VVEHLGDPGAVLVIDETGDLKKGAHTVGVGRQYTGTAGKVDNAQVAVYLAYATSAGHGVVDQIVANVVADGVVVPDRPAQEVLHAVRAGIPGVLGDRPAILAWQVGQQPQQERPGPAAWLHPAKPACDPAQQLLQPRLPAGRINPYAVAGGHRLIVGCSHNAMIDGGRPRPLPAPTPRAPAFLRDVRFIRG